MKCCLHLLVFLGSSLPLSALDPVETKLFSSRRDGNTTDDSFGLAMAGSDRWLVVGEPGNGEKGGNAGAAYLFDANTGALKRKLLASDGAANDAFGSAVAVNGNHIVIGAPGKDANRGKAYLFDALTGREKARMIASSPSAGDSLGSAVALAEDLVVVGAPGDDSGLGSLHLYSIQGLAERSDELTRMLASPRVLDSGFGFAVDTDGRFVVAGAPGEASNRGSVHVFEVSTAAQLLKITNTASAGDRLGQRVALGCGRVYASRPNAAIEAGAVNIYDVVSGALIRNLFSPESVLGAQFGFGMAVRENLLVVGQPEENNNGSGRVFVFDRDGQEELAITATDGTADDKIGSTVAVAGASSIFASADPGGNAIAYRFSKVLPPLYATLAAGLRVGDSAPGVGATRFSQVTAAVLGPDEDSDLLVRAAAGRVTGIWDRFDGALQPTLLTTSNLSPVPGGSEFVKGFGLPMVNDSGIALMPASFKSASVSPSNPEALLVKSGPVFATLVRLGNTFNTTAFGGSGTGTLAAMSQVVQASDTAGHRLAIAGRFKTGVGGVTALDDSVILVPDTNGNLDAADQENRFLPGSGGPTRLGQISPRVAFANKVFLYHAAVQSTLFREGLFLGTFNPGPGVIGAQFSIQGDAVGGAQINRYLGEALSGDEKVAFRAQVLGTNITTANNEMLVSNRFGSLEKILQKGEAVGTLPVFPGTVVAKVLRFWSLNGNRVAALVQFRGPRTSAANDVALVVANEAANNFTLLIQEGSIAPGCDGSLISVIQAVEIDAEEGGYFVLASLKGAVSGQDQALFSGSLSNAPLSRASLRRPFLELRKGSLFRTEFGHQAKITSMAFGVRASDATGASEKGLPSAVGQDRRAALILKFSDLSTQAVELQGE